ncbi:satratoxin biosynthesis SC1 cluster protein 4 [Colletotrichum spaethianum]|uniref:Satratoxin biosynthesis SC1 cluster protein 4 n=1 Tax=Colletotrichum spaethianum TaxID=700344 RepID=A0AA37NVA5_9PEZI|nr:satratoxin biosynthesis SC1 cluster protein 4 [Colletotrichum spaethianum]GKT43042.1 satratoxin biosynthesis SC1 cluster protein 4 [Colletotrichum spaethianum]
MRLFALFLSLAAVLSCAAAQGDATAAVSLLPTCAKLIMCQQSCLFTAVLGSSCAPTNQTCICTNAPLQAEVEVCVLQNCTLRNALTTKNITQTTCGAVPRDRTAMYNTISITMGSLSGAFVIIRLVHKVFATMGNLGMDDWFILTTLGSGIPGTVINTHGFATNGLGKDVWTVPFDRITDFGYWFFVMEPMYFGQVTLLKMSLLFFYMRIFSHNSSVKKLIWGTIAFNAVFGVTFIFVAVFQCTPISFYWTKWDLEHQGTCLDINAIAWAHAGISIVLDFWMLALPLSQIKSLNLHWKKKIGVAMMFFVGTFVTVVSILRLQSLVQFAKSQNPTWDQFDVATWSTVEINVGIICACMPSIRVILVSFFPKIMGSTRNGTSNAAKYYIQSSGNGRSRNRTLGNEAKIKTMDRESGSSSGSPNGIMYTKEYAVDYHDETSLVHMRELEAGSSKTGRSGSPF